MNMWRDRFGTPKSFKAELVTFLCAVSALLAACQPVVQSETLEDSALLRQSGAVLWHGLPKRAHNYVNMRLDQIEASPVMSGGVMFVGDSITDGAPLSAMFPNLKTANHGIAWDTTDGVLLRVAQITRHAPERIFFLIGTNDTDYTDDHKAISRNVLGIVDQVHAALPEVELYVVSVLPRGGPGNATITSVNEVLRASAVEHPYVYLDLANAMRGEDGEMNPALSYDNLHLNVHGYAVWERVLHDCVWNGCLSGLE
ncbi:MAG: GDSL-type esterase/lipase family protein [Pseudomonadota bacterium]